MGRKFLGQRICSETDLPLAGSYNLTTNDLINIPDAYEQLRISKGNNYGRLENERVHNGSTLSHKFGGTLRIKQRLSSVPELLMRGMSQSKTLPKNKARNFTPVLKQNSNANFETTEFLSERCVASRRKAVATVSDSNKKIYPPQPHRANRPSPLTRSPICSTQEIGAKTNQYIAMAYTNEYTNHEGMSVVHKLQSSALPRCRNSARQSAIQSDSEYQLEEIMKLSIESGRDSSEKSLFLKKQFEGFVDIIHQSMRAQKTFSAKGSSNKLGEFCRPTVISENTTVEDIQNSGVISDVAPFDILQKSLPTPPDYISSSSSEESSGEEFSELESLVPSLKLTKKSQVCSQSESDDVFHSCSENAYTSSPSYLQKNFSLRRNSELLVSTKILNTEDFYGLSEKEDDDVCSSIIDLSNEDYVTVVEDTSQSIYSVQD